ncbi:trehalose-phosphatase [Marinimicrobium sp. ABcell2]|uniref:trehalose-phosphatase n=1 Tax=Marinimicrobium sp. ABcell2 TaxID=3069751 RepID=UPI0027B0E265|nr:trehalose-phosphatase [Marinimicrobium sp. ABcell2]MDQ2078433.1 trehalose-phosphatase [Marinimicrobium sp. ABcell2]
MHLNNKESALFLDFDGTLVDFAATPEGVVVSEALRGLLEDLWVQFGGALALVSGRSIDSLDSLLNLPQLPVAGGHGAEWRWPGGTRSSLEIDSLDFAAAIDKLRAFADAQGLLMEDKSHSVALHFRQKPELENAIDHFIREQISELQGLRVIYGNCVREVQPLGVDKGVAVARFMQELPYRNRIPCYLGDDTTDEDAFAWVNANQGVSIKVGDGASCATHRLADTAEVLNFLRSLLRN